MQTLEVTLSTTDGPRAAEFWCAALGYRIAYLRDRYHVLMPVDGDGPRIVVQSVPEAARPDGAIHLDLRVDDPAGTVRRLADRGAVVRERVVDGDREWTVMQDPDGNAFCVCAARS